MTAIDDSTALALSMIGVVAFIALYVWVALALAAVFRKSGEEGWKAWVPILNAVVLLRLGGLSGWLLLLALIPFLGVLAVWVIVIIACHRVGAAFGSGPGMTVLAALLLPVWATIIGFGSSRWVGADPRGGARRTPSEVDDDGLAFLTALSDPGRPAATYPPIAPPPAYGRSQTPAAAEPSPPAGGWTPPPLPAQAPIAPGAASTAPPVPPMPSAAAAAAAAAGADPWEGLGLRPSDEFTGEVTGAVTGAPAPISAVPGTAHDIEDDESAGPRRGAAAAAITEIPTDAAPPVTRVPAAAAAEAAVTDEPWAPARSPMSDPEAFPETSGPVSAIAGAPDAGTPRSARASVSAQHTRPEIPDEVVEETIIAHRRRTQWSLVPPSGTSISLSAEVVMLGRRPVADPDFPDAQLVSIQDGTVSKTHARLELRDDRWFITDLGSTNGVLFATVLGTEVEATPGVEVEAGDRFLLGDAEVRLVRGDA